MSTKKSLSELAASKAQQPKKRQAVPGSKVDAVIDKLDKGLKYDPMKPFDTRKGSVGTIALCSFLIVILLLNIVLNRNWPSMVFVVLYGLLIRNRVLHLRKLS